jgi:tRNA pseudouridine32 synthase/23S rRNA pseudouridine746 synthase
VSIAPYPSWVAIPEDADFPTVLDFLDHRFPRVGRDVWRSRLDRRLVLAESGRPVTAEAPCRPRTRLRYFREVDREPRVPFREHVIYRDEHLLVADKPHFLPVVPAGPYVNECLVYRLRRATGEDKLTPVHRLDRVTAGLVLCSVRRETRTAYTRLFAERRVEKEYLAVTRMPTRSTVEDESGEALGPGRRWDVASRLVRGTPPFLTREAPGPPNAVTRLELLARGADLGLFRALPVTGKKHQIRFHLASLGFPILHERYYPELLPKAPVDFDRPLQLLARRLAFRDPLTGGPRAFVSRRRLAFAPDTDGLE